MNLLTHAICIIMAGTLIQSLAWAEIQNDKIDPKTRTKPTIAARIESQPREALQQVPEHPVVRFYQELGYLPVWIGPNGLLKPGEVLLKIVENAAKEGLFPDGHRLSVPETSLIDNLYGRGQKQTFSVL